MKLSAYDIVLGIVVSTLLFLLLACFLVAFFMIYRRRRGEYFREKETMKISFNNELLQSRIETQEDTFAQLGQELHDNVGQLLSTTKMLLGITERNLTEVPDTLKTAEETLGKAIQDIRALSKSLNKEWLQQFNLVENLRNEMERINTAGYVQANLRTDITELPLPAETQVMLFRIVQEALQNSIKHAGAKIIRIAVKRVEDEIELLITDDGTGFDAVKEIGKGVGIINMQHRTQLLAGTIAWREADSGGTEVYIRIPLTQKTISDEN